MTSGSWVTIETNRLKTMCTSSMPPSSVGVVKSLTSRWPTSRAVSKLGFSELPLHSAALSRWRNL